jgi:biotin operon repressor
MGRIPEHHEKELAARLSELMGSSVKITPPGKVHGPDESPGPGRRLIATTATHRFACLLLASGRAGEVHHALLGWSRSPEKPVPLLVAPFMGPAGKELCASAGVSWLDLSGNAEIKAPGLVVRVEGRPNRFRPRGRRWSAFAPKSSRVTRFLLMEPLTFQSQRQIATATGLSESFVSKIVARLEDDALIVRSPSARGLRPRDPSLLLEAWREDYDFFRHEVIRGHVTSTGGEDLLRRLAGTLADAGIRHVATGLAAWLLAPFAMFRLATVYVARMPGVEILEALGFHETERGSNTWLVVPNDEGVFQGAQVQEGVFCVHPVQAVLDLAKHPERSREAADLVRERHLGWYQERRVPE